MKKKKAIKGEKPDFREILEKRDSPFDPQFQERSVNEVSNLVNRHPTRDEIKKFMQADIGLGPFEIEMIRYHFDECETCTERFN